MDLIKELKKVRDGLKPTLVRRKEQINGIMFALELVMGNAHEKAILKAVKEKYLG